MSRSDFDFSLRAGQAREQAFQAILSADAADIEVKDEHKSRSHVFIEHECYGRPSGIAVTKATHWGIEVHRGWFVLIPTADIRMLHRLAIERYGVRNGGDFNAAFGAIVPKDWLVGFLPVERGQPFVEPVVEPVNEVTQPPLLLWDDPV